MKSARFGLSRHIQIFFETELCGLFRFDQIEFLEPEDAPRPPGMSVLRRPPFGKHREIVAVQFGAYNLSVCSPNEAPPLGEIVLTIRDGHTERGPLDETTWKKIGEFIRTRERDISNAA
jgi:hypothetical protein